MAEMTRRTVVAGAAGTLAFAIVPAAAAETGMSAGFVQLRLQLAASLAAHEKARRALDTVFPILDRQANPAAGGSFDACRAQMNETATLEAFERQSRAVRETIAAIFARPPVTPADERAIMDAIELYENEWWDAGVLRDAPRAFFTPQRFQDPARARELARDRDHYLDLDNDFEKFRTLPPYLASLRATQGRAAV